MLCSASFGKLSGYNPFNIIDGQTAGLNVSLSATEADLVTTDTTTEALNGLLFTLTQHGAQDGDTDTAGRRQ